MKKVIGDRGQAIVIFIICFIPVIIYGSPVKDSISHPCISSKTSLFPHCYGTFELKTSASVLFTRLPIDWIEITADVPIFQLNAVVGLPKGFSFHGNVESIYFSTQLRFGFQWNYELEKFTAGLGFDAAYMFGNMTVYGFNNHATSVLYYPYIEVGFRTQDVALTLRGELNFVNWLKVTSGKAEITREKRFLAGRSVGLFSEQKLWGNTMMIIGFSVLHQRFYYPAWPAFSFLTRYYVIPQLHIGLIL